MTSQISHETVDSCFKSSAGDHKWPWWPKSSLILLRYARRASHPSRFRCMTLLYCASLAKYLFILLGILFSCCHEASMSRVKVVQGKATANHSHERKTRTRTQLCFEALLKKKLRIAQREIQKKWGRSLPKMMLDEMKEESQGSQKEVWRGGDYRAAWLYCGNLWLKSLPTRFFFN